MAHKVYEAIVSRCLPYKLPAPWDRLPCDPAFVVLPPDREQLLLDLEQQFSREQLLPAGVVVVDAAGKLGWHPLLEPIGEPIWAVEKSGGEGVQSLIARQKVLGRNPRTALGAALADHRQAPIIAETNGKSGDQIAGREEGRADFVFVAFSMIDAAILRSLGLITAPGDDWTLSQRQLRSLVQTLQAPLDPLLSQAELASMRRVPAEAPTTEQADDPRHLVFLNWRLSALDLQEQPLAIRAKDEFEQLVDALDLEIESILLWKPSEAQRTKLQIQLVHGSSDQYLKRLLEALEPEAPVVVQPVAAAKPTQTDKRFEQLQRAFPSPKALHQAAGNGYRPLSTYDSRRQAFYEAQLLPLLRKAAQATCPLVQTLWLELAEVVWLRSALVEKMYSEMIEKSLRNQFGSDGRTQRDDQSQLDLLFGREQSIRQELRECQTPPVATRPPSPTSKPLASGLSDLWTMNLGN